MTSETVSTIMRQLKLDLFVGKVRALALNRRDVITFLTSALRAICFAEHTLLLQKFGKLFVELV